MCCRVESVLKADLVEKLPLIAPEAPRIVLLSDKWGHIGLELRRLEEIIVARRPPTNIPVMKGGAGVDVGSRVGGTAVASSLLCSQVTKGGKESALRFNLSQRSALVAWRLNAILLLLLRLLLLLPLLLLMLLLFLVLLSASPPAPLSIQTYTLTAAAASFTTRILPVVAWEQVKVCSAKATACLLLLVVQYSHHRRVQVWRGGILVLR